MQCKLTCVVFSTPCTVCHQTYMKRKIGPKASCTEDGNFARSEIDEWGGKLFNRVIRQLFFDTVNLSPFALWHVMCKYRLQPEHVFFFLLITLHSFPSASRNQCRVSSFGLNADVNEITFTCRYESKYQHALTSQPIQSHV